jgi:hypothetical protein
MYNDPDVLFNIQTYVNPVIFYNTHTNYTLLYCTMYKLRALLIQMNPMPQVISL